MWNNSKFKYMVFQWFHRLSKNGMWSIGLYISHCSRNPAPLSSSAPAGLWTGRRGGADERMRTVSSCWFLQSLNLCSFLYQHVMGLMYDWQLYSDKIVLVDWRPGENYWPHGVYKSKIDVGLLSIRNIYPQTPRIHHQILLLSVRTYCTL